MITMMVLLCYVNLSGMSLECIVIVLMNNSLLGGQFCTDYVNVQQGGDYITNDDLLVIIPRLNFTCNGRITSIRATLFTVRRGRNYPFFQVWRSASVDLIVYTKIGEVQLQLDQLSVLGSGVIIATTILTTTSTIDVQSGDVVGYYLPSNPSLRVISIQTDGYRAYGFSGLQESVDLNNKSSNNIV